MGNPHGPNLWETALHKLFYKRASQRKEKESQLNLPLEPGAEISEHTDGFYMYSQSMLNEAKMEKERVEMMEGEVDRIMQEREKREGLRSGSSETSFASALMCPVSPVDRGLPAYAIDSPDWDQPGALDGDSPDENGLDKVSSVMAVYSRVYGVAKIVYVAFVSFGVELDDNPTGFLFHIKRAEETARSTSLPELKETVENLYYAVYSRLIAEMANVELCSSFTGHARSKSAKDFITLPEPSHMYKIFLSCKEVLDSPRVCASLNKHTIRVCQKGFIRRIMDKMNQTGFSYDDLLGYRRHVVDEVAKQSSPFMLKWLPLAIVYRMPPAEILATLSEKYLSMVAKAPIPHDTPITDLPLVNPDTIRPDIWERQIIQDNRDATLAKLEGRVLGEIRRQEHDSRELLDFAKERKCTCEAICSCAHECTLNVERGCPCAPRMIRILLAVRRKEAGGEGLDARCSCLAKAVFDGLAVVVRDIDDEVMVGLLGREVKLLEREMQKERAA